MLGHLYRHDDLGLMYFLAILAYCSLPFLGIAGLRDVVLGCMDRPPGGVNEAYANLGWEPTYG